MEFDITKTVEKIAMQAKENQEEFIFETIRPYCENILQIKINKEELKQILLNGMQKQHPCEDIINRTELLVRIDNERKHLLDLNMDGAEHIIVHHARRIIEDMPSVTPNWDKKIKNAESTDWVRKGLSNEEVEKIVINAQKNARERI